MKTESWFIQATVILALITFVGYWSVLSFEKGFCTYFGIPYYFISLSPTFVLSGSIIWALIVPALCILIFVVLVITEVYIRSNKYLKIFLTISMMVIYLWLNNIFTKETYLWLDNTSSFIMEKNTLVILTVAAIVVLTIISISRLGWLYRHHKKEDDDKIRLSNTLSGRLYALYKKEADNKIRLSNTWKFVNTLGVILGFSIFLVLVFGYFLQLGTWQAKTQQLWFAVIGPQSSTNTNIPEVVVLRNYGEYLYTVPFTRKTNEYKAQFENKIFIVKMSDVKTPLTWEMVGPLEPVGAKP